MDPSSAQNQVFQRPEQERRGVMMMKPQQLNCPRCDSTNTKFCYYNNYSLLQPRYFCKACKRYWTQGGTLRNVPKGGGGFKKSNKRRSSSPSIRRGGDHHQQQQQIVMNTTNSSSTQVFSSLLPPLAFGNNFMGQFGLDGFHEYGDATTTTTATVITTNREELVCKQGGDEENRGWDFQWSFGGEGECMSGVGLDSLSWQELVDSPAQ